MTFQGLIDFVRVRIDDVRKTRFANDSTIAAEANEQCQYVIDLIEPLVGFPRFLVGQTTINLNQTDSRYVLPADCDGRVYQVRRTDTRPYQPCRRIDFYVGSEYEERGSPTDEFGRPFYWISQYPMDDVTYPSRLALSVPAAGMQAWVFTVDYRKTWTDLAATDTTTALSLAMPSKFHILPAILTARNLMVADKTAYQALDQEFERQHDRAVKTVSWQSEPGEIFDGPQAP